MSSNISCVSVEVRKRVTPEMCELAFIINGAFYSSVYTYGTETMGSWKERILLAEQVGYLFIRVVKTRLVHRLGQEKRPNLISCGCLADWLRETAEY